MTSLAAQSKLPPMAKPTMLCVDIMIVVAVSGLTFFLEGIAFAQGWIPLETEIKGAISVLTGACAAIAVVFFRGGSFADLGFKRPKRWAVVPLQVTAILVAFIVAQAALPQIIALFLTVPEPDFSRYDSITGNLAAAITMALVLPLTASIPEEIIYRGFLMGRLSELFSEDLRGASMTVLVQALIFGSVHFQWGIGGMIMTFCMGAVWGTAYLLCGRNLWIVILAHSAGHILFVTQLYLGESIIV